jgi:hypothetical protein
MPCGNCLRVARSIADFICGCIRPVVRFATSDSRSIPSIRSSGSMMLPLDFDIFWPCSSRIRPVMYTSRNGTSSANLSPIMIIRATQKKMMSNPVTSTEPG